MIQKALQALALAIALTAAPLAAAAATAPPIPFKERTLANGLKVFYSLDKTTPNVTVQVWYGVGSKDDPEGRSGFAHLFEHMMFKATHNMPAESLDRFTEDVGGFNNASTYDDFTNYYEVVPANHLERLLWFEAERMGSLVVDDEGFKSERDVVKEELRQRVLADPYGRLFNLALPKGTYTSHPYRRPGIGSIEELDAATIDDVRAFHETYYRPDNAVLLVVGNYDEAKLAAWVDKYFAPLKKPAQPLPRVTAVEPAKTAPRTVTAYGPNVPLPAVAVTWLGPKAADADAPALDVLDAILSAGDSSRLYNSLVYKQQAAAQVFSDADTPAQAGMFVVGAVMASGHTVEEGEKALRAEVARLRDAPPTAAELAEAKNTLVADALRERETIDGRAYALGYAYWIEGDAKRADTAIADLQKVTAADVQRVARKYLGDERRTVIRYLPESAKTAAAPDILTAETAPKVASKPFAGQVFALAPEAQRETPPAIAEPVATATPDPAEKTLANGLRVIVARSSSLPLVTANLLVKAGASSDPQGLAGAVGMTAGMVTEGTKTRTAPQVHAAIEALGATLSSGGGAESSSVSLSTVSDQAKAALAIMADVAQNPAFAADELERQRAQALDGLQVAYQRPGSLAGFAAGPVVYAGTPLGHVSGGTPGSIAKLKREDLAKLHAAYWRPDNAILVLAGDLTPEQGFTLAQGAFGGWRKPATPLPAQPAVTPSAPPRALAIDLPGTGQAAVTVVKPAVARRDARYYPAIVANTVLGGGYSARLNQEIRIKRGLSYGASSGLTTRRTTGAVSAQAQTKNESAAEVLGLIREEMRKLAATPASADELKARKSVLVGSYGRELATSAGLAGILGDLAFYDIGLDELGRYTGKVEAVTADQVRSVAAEVFDPAKASVIVAGDAKSFQAPLAAAAPGLEVIPATQLDLDSPTLKKGG